MQNIELKAELRDIETARAVCRSVGAQRIGTLRQTDTYYMLADGRLKKREAPGEPTEWIFYHRPDSILPRKSSYTILSEDQARVRWGTQSLRTWVTVVKTRELWMVDNIRIHLDTVDELGTFLELEGMVSEQYDASDCQQAVVDLRSEFMPILGEMISVGYSDLLQQHQDTQVPRPD